MCCLSRLRGKIYRIPAFKLGWHDEAILVVDVHGCRARRRRHPSRRCCWSCCSGGSCLLLLLFHFLAFPVEALGVGLDAGGASSAWFGNKDAVTIYYPYCPPFPNKPVQNILDVYPQLQAGVGAIGAAPLTRLKRHPRERLGRFHVSYTHSCSLHVAAQLTEEVSGSNRSMSVALANNRKVNRLHTAVDGIHDHIEDIPAMLDELRMPAELIEDVGVCPHVLGVRTLLLLKSMLLGLIRVVSHAGVWDMSHIQKNACPGQTTARHRYR